MTRVLRRSAPRFDLNLPPRKLQPMTVVSSDCYGACYAVQAGAEQRWAAGPSCGHNNSNSNSNSNSCSSFTATRITPHLYLGSHGDALCASELRRQGIQRVLNVAEECPAVEAGDIQTKHITLRDHSDEDITRHFEEAMSYIHDGIRKGESVLVHCRFGVSRSATIVIAYLMRFGVHEERQQVTPYEEVFNFVKERRPQVSPNLGFVLALHALDEQQRGVALTVF